MNVVADNAQPRTRTPASSVVRRVLALTVVLAGAICSSAFAADPLWWQTPADGQLVSGVLNEANGNCRVGLEDGIDVDRVEFYVDGVYLNTERYAPYSCVWDTRTATSGSHVLTSVGFDSAGRSATTSVRVTVGSPSPPPPPPPPPPAPPPPPVSCDRYASPSGSDTGPGTHASPYRTISKLRDTLTAGQTGCLRQGTYGSAATWTEFDRSGTSGHPITYMSYPGERATLVGGYTVTGDHITLSHLSFDQNYVRPRVYHANCSSVGALALDIYSSHVTLEYNDISQASVAATQRDTAVAVWARSSGARTTDVVIANNKIHDFGSCSAYDHGIYFDHTSNGRIYGNWIYNDACSYGQGGGDRTRGCGAGIQLYVDPIATQVHGNVIDGTGLGFYLAGSGANVYNNIITNTRGYYQTSYASGPVAISGAGGQNNTFTDNAMFNVGRLCADCSGLVNTTGNTIVDPQYTDRANRNYALKSTSPIPASWGIWDGTG